jgi:hypothetical protein
MSIGLALFSVDVIPIQCLNTDTNDTLSGVYVWSCAPFVVALLVVVAYGGLICRELRIIESDGGTHNSMIQKKASERIRKLWKKGNLYIGFIIFLHIVRL